MPSSSNSGASQLHKDHLHQILRDFFPGIKQAILEDIAAKMSQQRLDAGEILFRQDEDGDSFYVLLSGRLQAIVNENSNSENIAGEILKGESVGEMSLITGEKRSATVKAVRDSFLVKLSRSDFESLAAKEPKIIMAATKQVVKRLTNTIHRVSPRKSYSSIALFPLGRVKESDFMEDIFKAAKICSDVIRLNKGLLHQELSSDGDPDISLSNWLSEKETQHDLLFYQTEGDDSEWTRKSLRQADKILVIIHTEDGPGLTAEEEQLLQNNEMNCELVIIHPADTDYPQYTAEFLAKHNVKQHYHIREGNERDLHRLGRIITGNANALVLAGGGAKGFAHVGVFKALSEAKIPIDLVAGTSIGSIMGAAIAMGWEPDEVYSKCKQAFLKEKPLQDYTLPVISLVYGGRFQRVIKKYFNDIQIEDLWINFFCVSSNFSTSESVVHQQGTLYKALAASASIPGVLPPVVSGNHLLVDGGLINNFPVDIMRELYDCNIIGVDLNAEKQYDLNYDSIPSGWRYMAGKFLKLGKSYRIPGIATIMMKATILGSRKKQAEMKDEVDLFLKPPIERYKPLDMKAFDPLVKKGYEYAREILQDESLKNIVYVSESQDAVAAKD